MTDNRELAAALPRAVAVCCREWVVIPAFGLGRCGSCGTVPVIARPEHAPERKP